MPTADGTIGINWTLFQGVFDAIDTPLVNAVNGILTALTGYVDGPLKAFVTFALAAGALVVAIRPDVLPLNWLFANLIRAAVVIFLVANVDNFNQYVGNLFLQILPNEIGNAINGTLNGGGAPINGGAQFDTDESTRSRLDWWFTTTCRRCP